MSSTSTRAFVLGFVSILLFSVFSSAALPAGIAVEITSRQNVIDTGTLVQFTCSGGSQQISHELGAWSVIVDASYGVSTDDVLASIEAQTGLKVQKLKTVHDLTGVAGKETRWDSQHSVTIVEGYVRSQSAALAKIQIGVMPPGAIGKFKVYIPKSDEVTKTEKDCPATPAVCGNGKAEQGEQCGEPGLSCQEGTELCVNCRCLKVPDAGDLPVPLDVACKIGANARSILTARTGQALGQGAVVQLFTEVLKGAPQNFIDALRGQKIHVRVTPSRNQPAPSATPVPTATGARAPVVYYRLNGKTYVVVSANDPNGDTGTRACAKLGMQCVGYTDQSTTVCKYFHPDASANDQMADGSNAGYYCNGAPQTGTCGMNVNSCQRCPACSTNADCNFQVGSTTGGLFREMYAECAGTPPTSPTGTCTPNWSCTAWSACDTRLAFGYVKRTCTDTNNCGTNTGKPAESQACNYATATPVSTPAPTPAPTQAAGVSVQIFSPQNGYAFLAHYPYFQVSASSSSTIASCNFNFHPASGAGYSPSGKLVFNAQHNAWEKTFDDINLPYGCYQITFTCADSSGQQGTAITRFSYSQSGYGAGASCSYPVSTPTPTPAPAVSSLCGDAVPKNCLACNQAQRIIDKPTSSRCWYSGYWGDYNPKPTCIDFMYCSACGTGTGFVCTNQ